jgi:inosose dehydratase
MSNAAGVGSPSTVIRTRLAAGPISWGVCEVPGWGLQLDADRVLGEMHQLGIGATEAGPDGYLGTDADAVKELLDRNELQLVGGFLPVVLHDPGQLSASLAKVRRTAKLFSDLGARFLCAAAVVDDDWSPRTGLSPEQWKHLLASLPLVDEAAAELGVVHVLHPHWRTTVEQDADVKRVLEGSDVRICLDTGHLALGGSDPLEIARAFGSRVAHVHLKDVSTPVAERLRAGELDLVGAVQHGLFRPLGAGDVAVDELVVELERSGYTGWYVLEQDTAILDAAPPAGAGPIEDVRTSITYLEGVAQRGPAAIAAGEGR